MEHPLIRSPSPPPSPSRSSRLLARWRKSRSASNLDSRSGTREGSRGTCEGTIDWQGPAEPHTAQDVPAILQERRESITVLEILSAQPTQLKTRCCNRQELFELASTANTLAQPGAAPPLRLRDMRRLDPSIAQHSPPSLMMRHGALLISITRLGTDSRGSINAILQHNRCIFLARGQDDASVYAVHQQLVRLLAASSGDRAANIPGAVSSSCGNLAAAPAEGEELALPFEFLALEAMLLHATDALAETTSALSRLVELEVNRHAPSELVSGGRF